MFPYRLYFNTGYFLTCNLSVRKIDIGLFHHVKFFLIFFEHVLIFTLSVKYIIIQSLRIRSLTYCDTDASEAVHITCSHIADYCTVRYLFFYLIHVGSVIYCVVIFSDKTFLIIYIHIVGLRVKL